MNCFFLLFVQVKEKRGELQIIKSTFVGKASEYMRNYFATFVDFMLNDKNYFSQVFSGKFMINFWSIRN